MSDRNRDLSSLRRVPRAWLHDRLDASCAAVSGSAPGAAVQEAKSLILKQIGKATDGDVVKVDSSFCNKVFDILRIQKSPAHEPHLSVSQGKSAGIEYRNLVDEVVATFPVVPAAEPVPDAECCPACAEEGPKPTPEELKSRAMAAFDRMCGEGCAQLLRLELNETASSEAVSHEDVADVAKTLFRLRFVRKDFQSALAQWKGAGNPMDAVARAMSAAVYGDGSTLSKQIRFAQDALVSPASEAPVSNACFKASIRMLGHVRDHIMMEPITAWFVQGPVSDVLPTSDVTEFLAWLRKILAPAAEEPTPSAKELTPAAKELMSMRDLALNMHGLLGSPDIRERLTKQLDALIQEEISRGKAATVRKLPEPRAVVAPAVPAFRVPAGVVLPSKPAVPAAPDPVPAPASSGPEEILIPENFFEALAALPPSPLVPVRAVEPAPLSAPEITPEPQVPVRPVRVKGLAPARRKLEFDRKARDAARRDKYAANAAKKELSLARAASDAAQETYDRLAAQSASADTAVETAKASCAADRLSWVALEKEREGIFADINAAAKAKDQKAVKRLVAALVDKAREIEGAQARLDASQNALYASNKAKRALWLPSISAQRALDKATAAEKEHVKAVGKTYNKAVQVLDKKTAAFEKAQALVASLENPAPESPVAAKA